jgi:DNA-binding MarR family transcriptional regulator
MTDMLDDQRPDQPDDYSDAVDAILAQWRSERPDLDPGPIGVIGRISRLEQHLGPALQRAFEPFGLQRGDFDVLATLRRSGAPYQLTPTALYQTLMLSSGAMTNRLDRLEGLELLKRQANPDDRRGLLIALTPKGQALIDKAMTAHIENEQRIVAVLGTEERRQLAGLLRKLLLSFEFENK